MSKPGLDLEEEDEGTTSTTDTPGASAKPQTKPVVVDDDAEFGDENEYVRPGELNRVATPEKNKFIRFSILAHPDTGKALMKKGYVHYVDKKGYAKCLSKRDKKGNFVGAPEFCCKEKPGDSRYAVLVVQYSTVNPTTGKFLKDVPVQFEVKCLNLTRIGFKDISNLMTDGVDEGATPYKITDMDITGTPKDEVKGLKFSRVTSKPSYTKYPELEQMVRDQMTPFLDCEELRRKVGKQVNRAEMKLHLGVAVAADETPGMDDLDD